MNKPIVADNKPIAVLLNKDDYYYFCTCGRSNNQPFCDGSHKDTSLKPLKFQAESDKKVYLCACKHSSKLPFCDGTHKQFSLEDVGK